MEKLEQKDKYYIPSIDEFYVGFECNLFSCDHGCWGKYIVKNFDSPKELLDLCECEQLRVKYLDREDIKSLGFNEIISDQYTLGDIELLIDDDLFVQIIKDNGFLFQGTIKNKSEFKKVLKMIGYEN